MWTKDVKKIDKLIVTKKIRTTFHQLNEQKFKLVT